MGVRGLPSSVWLGSLRLPSSGTSAYWSLKLLSSDIASPLALVLLLPPSLVALPPCRRPLSPPWNAPLPHRLPSKAPAHRLCWMSSSFDCCILLIASVALLSPCCCPSPLLSNTTTTIVAPAHRCRQTPSSHNHSPSLFVDCCVCCCCHCLLPLPRCYLAVIHHRCHQMPSNAAAVIEWVVVGSGWG